MGACSRQISRPGCILEVLLRTSDKQREVFSGDIRLLPPDRPRTLACSLHQRSTKATTDRRPGLRFVSATKDNERTTSDGPTDRPTDRTNERATEEQRDAICFVRDDDDFGRRRCGGGRRRRPRGGLHRRDCGGEADQVTDKRLN